MTRITLQRMVNVLGPVPKPEEVWQKQFDGHEDKLLQLARIDWDKVIANKLLYYFLDLAYMELQPDLFRYVFPACLKFWYDTLMQDEGTDLGDSDFHAGMMKGNIAQTMLSDQERQRLWDFFHDAFMDRFEEERELPKRLPWRSRGWEYRGAWIARLNSFNAAFPLEPAKRVWESWWALDHPSKAVCAFMYASGLIYSADDNPLYAHIQPGVDGGPFLMDLDGHIYDPWLPANIAFLKSTLTADYIAAKLSQAAQALKGRADFELATQIAQDAASRREAVTARINLLIKNLALPVLERDKNLHG